MPSAALVTIYAALSIALLLWSGGAEALLAERLDLIRAPAQGTGDVTRGLARLTSEALPAPVVVSILSWLGWGLSFALLRLGRWGKLYLPLAIHPATVLLTAGGFGLAVAALLAVFISMEQLTVSRSKASLPSLGLALGSAALLVPGFRALFVAFAAPLVIVAPRAMLERNMLAFYLVALLPAVSVIMILLFFSSAPFGVAAAPVPAASVPLALASIPAAGLAFAAIERWRISVVLSIISVGAFLVSQEGAGWPLALSCLAAAFALHRQRKPVASVIFAGLVVLAALLLARHMASL